MIEICFLGRYGQPVSSFSNKIAKKAIANNKFAQVFDSFSAYRPGAMLKSTLRVDDNFILKRSANNSSPDVVVVLDNSLFEIADVTASLKEGGTVIALNAESKILPEKLNRFKLINLSAAENKEEALSKAVEELIYS